MDQRWGIAVFGYIVLALVWGTTAARHPTGYYRVAEVNDGVVKLVSCEMVRAGMSIAVDLASIRGTAQGYDFVVNEDEELEWAKANPQRCYPQN